MAFPDGWGRKCALTIDSAHIDSTLTNFTAVFTQDMLPSEMFDADGSYPALDGGGDVRFSSDEDGVTRLACDVRVFETDNNPANGVADIAVKIPSISSSTDTTIYVWYNKSGESQPVSSDTYGRNNTYDSGFLLVYSMSENPASSAPQFIDRTGNGNSGTTTGNPTNISGVAADGVNFDGSGDSVAIPTLPPLTADFMISTWTYSNASAVQLFVSFYQNPYLDMRVDTNAGGTGLEWQAFSGSYFGGYHMRSNVTPSGWSNVTLGRTSGLNTLYVNSVATSTYANSEILPTSTPRLASINSGGYYFNGYMDEIRVSNVSRSAAWVRAEYENLRPSGNTFVSAGTPVSPVVSSNIPVFYNHRQSQGMS